MRTIFAFFDVRQFNMYNHVSLNFVQYLVNYLGVLFVFMSFVIDKKKWILWNKFDSYLMFTFKLIKITKF